MFRYIDVTESQKKILVAALSLLEREGYQSLTVRKICEEAGCALGTFYHSFKSRDDILSFLILNEYNRFKEEKKEVLKELGPLEKITELLSDMVLHFTAFGIGFLEEFFTPKNKTINHSIHGRLDQRYAVVENIKSELWRAEKAGILKNREQPEEIFIDRLYLDIESIFYGVVFNWTINNGMFDIVQVFRRELGIYLNYYKG